jgi:hypothetical protein
LNDSLTLTGRLKDFAKEQLKKVEKIFEGSTNEVKNNPILNAVGSVIKSACHAVGTIAKGTYCERTYVSVAIHEACHIDCFVDLRSPR